MLLSDSIMEIEKNILPEDDSDTDYDCDEESSSSDDDENFTRKFGNIKTKTSCQGKVQIKPRKEEDQMEEDEEDEEVDDFEAEMERELAQRVFEAETKAAIANTDRLTNEDDEEFDDNDIEMPSGSKAKKDIKDKPKSDKYEDIYFDSDEEEGDQRKVVSNDDLFYDPGQDAADQTWVDEVRQSYQMSRPGDSVKKLPNSDAVLNCPACFSGMYWKLLLTFDYLSIEHCIAAILSSLIHSAKNMSFNATCIHCIP